MKKLALVLAALLWQFLPVAARAADGTGGEASASSPEALAQLNSLVDSLGSLQLSFVQSIYSADGELLDRTRGRMALRQPGNFYWETMEPWAQYIIVNSEHFWSYDPDLQQVIRRSSRQVLQHTPAAVLTRMARPEQYFAVRFAESVHDGEGGMRPLLLLPHDPGAASFRSMTLHHSASVLHMVSYIDSFSKRTEIMFAELAEPFAGGGPDFSFRPPQGVDVITDE